MRDLRDKQANKFSDNRNPFLSEQSGQGRFFFFFFLFKYSISFFFHWIRFTCAFFIIINAKYYVAIIIYAILLCPIFSPQCWKCTANWRNSLNPKGNDPRPCRTFSYEGFRPRCSRGCWNFTALVTLLSFEEKQLKDVKPHSEKRHRVNAGSHRTSK